MSASGLKKTAAYRDVLGRLRAVDFFLPAELWDDMKKPIETQFLEGEEAASFARVEAVVQKNFKKAEP